jgi:hypothetical protein
MIFAAITLCVASQQVFIVVVVHFFIESVRKLLDTPSCKMRSPFFCAESTVTNTMYLQ